MLAGVLAIGMAVSSFAALPTTAKIKSINEDGFIAAANNIKVTQNSKTTSETSPSALSDMEVAAGAQVRIYFTPAMFKDAQGKVLSEINPNMKISTAMLRTGKITLRRSSQEGSAVVKNVSIANDNGNAYIKVEFVDDFVSIKDQDFAIRLYLYANGRRVQNTRIDVTGTMRNKEETVYSDDDYVDLSTGVVAVPDAYIRSIEADLGNGVIMDARMFKGRKYYGKASTKISEADEVVLTKNYAIDMVYTLSGINLKRDGNVISFDLDDTYYIYDGNGKYLGTSAQKLPWADKYYVASKKFTLVK